MGATFKKEPPRTLTRDLLVHQLAWCIQEKAFGGHGAATLRLPDRYGQQDADKVVLHALDDLSRPTRCVAT
jgi:hypothetical protein